MRAGAPVVAFQSEDPCADPFCNAIVVVNLSAPISC